MVACVSGHGTVAGGLEQRREPGGAATAHVQHHAVRQDCRGAGPRWPECAGDTRQRECILGSIWVPPTCLTVVAAAACNRWIGMWNWCRWLAATRPRHKSMPFDSAFGGFAVVTAVLHPVCCPGSLIVCGPCVLGLCCFVRGIADVVPLQLLELMRWEDLEQRLCGGTIDIDVLRQHTTYGGTAIGARVVRWCVSRACAHSQAA